MIQKLLYWAQFRALLLHVLLGGRMPDNASFGSWLKQRRKTLDLTQAELARLVGCATVTIHSLWCEICSFSGTMNVQQHLVPGGAVE